MRFKSILLTSTTILIAIYVVSGFGNIYICVREFKWKWSITSRSPNRRSQGEGCTRAALRTFLQLSRTLMRFPSKPYERPSFFRGKREISFPGRRSLGSLMYSLWNLQVRRISNILRSRVEDRRGTIQRGDCCLLDESAPWSYRTHARRRSRYCAGITRALRTALLHPNGRNAQDGHNAGCSA